MVHRISPKLIAFSVSLLFLTGCSSPKITSERSPFNVLNSDTACFVFPSMDFFKQSPIYKQTLYKQSKNSLDSHNVRVTYGKDSTCKNYFDTDWISGSPDSIGTIKTTTNGNIFDSTFESKSITTNTPNLAVNNKTFYGIYILKVGLLNDDETFIETWKGSIGGRTSRTTMVDASRVADNLQPIVDKMVKRMLIENNFIKFGLLV